MKLENTHFANAHGLNAEDLYSTPYDIALQRAIIRDLPDNMAYTASARLAITVSHSTTAMVYFVIEA